MRGGRGTPTHGGGGGGGGTPYGQGAALVILP